MNIPKVALVTGAARRIGRAIALDLAREDYHVAVHYNRSADDASDVVNEIVNAGGFAHCFQADLADEIATQALVPQVLSTMGRLDVLVNNAAIFEEEDWHQVTRQSWDKHLDVNLRAPFLLMQEFAKAISGTDKGSIVNIIDQRVWNLNPHFISYTLAKSGLWTLTQTMALALAPNIRVNAIGPGPTLRNVQQMEDDFTVQFKSIPLQQATELAEICGGIRYLLTANSLTGQMLALDGGEHLGWAQVARNFAPNA